MCTVTIVPYDDGFRMACNRDERRDRAAATSPTVRCLPHGRAAYPVDPVGGGTWVGVNSAGVAAALLNRTAAALPGAASGLRSRGLLIPALLDSCSLEGALDRASRLNPRDFNPFRLVVVHERCARVLTSDGQTLLLQSLDMARPAMLTSSSLGDDVVEPPRRRLFDRMMLGDRSTWLDAQARFHADRWPSHARFSVRMERPDARTVSRTLIDVTSHGIELCYEPFDAAGGAPSWPRPCGRQTVQRQLVNLAASITM